MKKTVMSALSALLAFIVTLSLSVIPVNAGQSADTPTPAGSYILPVFETSDTHGYVADISGESCQYRLAYISDKVRDARGSGENSRKDRAVLLDGGDIYQGNTLSNLVKGSSLSAAYELMDYDAVTIGNHEFDWGIATTDRTAGGRSNPLCAWNDTARLVSSDTTDIDGALDVLTTEASENGGLLFVDDKAHFIEFSTYTLTDVTVGVYYPDGAPTELVHSGDPAKRSLNF